MALYAIISFIIFIMSARLSWKVKKSLDYVEQIMEEEAEV